MFATEEPCLSRPTNTRTSISPGRGCRGKGLRKQQGSALFVLFECLFSFVNKFCFLSSIRDHFSLAMVGQGVGPRFFGNDLNSFSHPSATLARCGCGAPEQLGSTVRYHGEFRPSTMPCMLYTRTQLTVKEPRLVQHSNDSRVPLNPRYRTVNLVLMGNLVFGRKSAMK